MNKLMQFFGEVRKEAGKVTWPTRKETMITSVMVIVLTIIFGLFLLLVDGVLATAIRFIINLHL